MADRVVARHAQHRRHVRHLDAPEALGRQDALDGAREGDGVLEIVEHRDRRHDVAEVAVERVEQIVRREEIVDDGDARGDLVGEVGGIDADLRERRGVGGEQRAVVAADVEHARPGPTIKGARLLGDAAQVICHRGVRARPVPVHRVEDLGRHGVLRLQQAARLLVELGVAAHERRGYAPQRRDLPSRLEERALEVLLTEVDDLSQRRGLADPARGPVDEMHGGLERTVYRPRRTRSSNGAWPPPLNRAGRAPSSRARRRAPRAAGRSRGP